jgi:hypothetical protein
MTQEIYVIEFNLGLSLFHKWLCSSRVFVRLNFQKIDSIYGPSKVSYDRPIRTGIQLTGYI